MHRDPARIAIEAEALYGILDHLDYFQLLQLSEEATPGEIREAYRNQSRIFHPDRFYQHEDQELRTQILEIFKRITEAYTVLRDDERRRLYREGISGPDREKKIRWVEKDAKEKKKANEAEVGKTPNGKRLYGAALADWKAGRLDAAERNLRMALVFEPDNALFRQKLDEVSELLRSSK